MTALRLFIIAYPPMQKARSASSKECAVCTVNRKNSFVVTASLVNVFTESGFRSRNCGTRIPARIATNWKSRFLNTGWSLQNE